jgi:hypothetical protein
MPAAASAIISFIRKASLSLYPDCLPRSVALSLKKFNAVGLLTAHRCGLLFLRPSEPTNGLEPF